jgi:hypothetical protein
VTLCSVVDSYQHFRGTCSLHIQDRSVSWAWKKMVPYLYPEDGGCRFHWNYPCHIPKDSYLHSHLNENLKSHHNLSRVRRLYERGFGLSTGFIGSQVGYTLTTESLTIITDSQLSLLQLQLTLTTESLLFLWRLPLQLCNQLLWHPLPSLTQLTCYIAWDQTTKKTRLPPLLPQNRPHRKRSLPIVG